MIWTIAKKEFLEYLKSPRLVIALLVTLVLVTVTTVIDLKDFKDRRRDYFSAEKEMTGDQINIRIYRPPEVLSVFAEGKDKELGSLLEMTSWSLPIKTSGFTGEGVSQHHRFESGFSSVDYAFIVRVILSLLVIFMTYNLVSGEKSKGTLRWVLANPIPRSIFLFGKCLGGWLITMCALFSATIATLLILTLDPDIDFGGSEWVRIISMFGTSALYLTCIFTLGLLVSVITDRPSISLTALLQIWIFIVIIYPNVSIIVAENWYKLPSYAEIERMKEAAVLPFEAAYKKSIGDAARLMYRGEHLSDEDYSNYIDLQTRHAAAYHHVDVEFGNALTHQVAFEQILSFLSPPALYDQTMTAFARTDLQEFDTFMHAANEYWLQVVEFLKLKAAHRVEREGLRFPEFSFAPRTFDASFVGAVPQVLILFLLGSIFFVLAYLKFLKKDVR